MNGYPIKQRFASLWTCSGGSAEAEDLRATGLRLSVSLGVLIFCFSSTTLFAQILNTNQSQPPVTVVVGTDNPSVDVAAVQSAVDKGGTVILRGTFDFGNDAGNHIIVPGRAYPAQDDKGRSTVFIYQADVRILGETGLQGELLTVIKNGRPTFWIGWDGEALRLPPSGTSNVDFGTESFPQDALGRVAYRDGFQDPGYSGPQTRYARAFQNINVTIKSIYFDSPKHYGIKAAACHDVSVIGNVFKNVQFGGLVHANNVFPATSIAAGFIAAGSLYAPFIFPAITGEVVAERNLVDGSGTEPIHTHSGECFGLGALATHADVTIARNEIRNIGRGLNGIGSDATAGSILLVDNYSESLLVTQNTVYNSSGYGIYDLAVFAATPGATIEHNTLTNCVNGILSYSYAGPRSGVTIHQNAFLQDGLMGSGGSCIIGNALSDSLIRANTFEGEYIGPLVVFLSSTDCTLLENRDLRPRPLLSPTYFLDVSSSGNLVRGAGTALDLGSNNSILLIDN